LTSVLVTMQTYGFGKLVLALAFQALSLAMVLVLRDEALITDCNIFYISIFST